jgi:small nuclear ribonucleoprotein (snRNP)-like protein
MNLVLDDAEEVYIEKSGKETKARQDLGKYFRGRCRCDEEGGGRR